MHRNPIRTSSIRLHLETTVDQLPRPLRDSLSEWLVAHGVDPGEIAPGSTIERDEYLGRLTWRVATPQGLRVRMRYHPRSDDAVWPTPFPETLRLLPACA